MEQVADNVFKLGSRAHNFYALIEDDQIAVIDAGCVREWSKLGKGLSAAGLSVDQIAGFLITHVHGDHFGMARKATEQDIDVVVHVDDEPRALGTYEGRFSAGASDLPLYKPRAIVNFMPLLIAGVMSNEHVERVGTFVDGETLDVPGQPVAVHTPGHTEGHTMFHCPDLGLLFTGDGLVTMDLLGPGSGPQHMNEVFDVDSARADESLSRIIDLKADLLLPGHGRPWTGRPADAVALARS